MNRNRNAEIEVKFRWNPQQLLELTRHVDGDVRRWAVHTLIRLYPDLVLAVIDTFLDDKDEKIVLAALEYLETHSEKRWLERLEMLYLSGPAKISARAVEIAGIWQVEEAVEWMKRQIMESKRLSSGQIDAMVRALGRIPGNAAYELLKASESVASSRGDGFFSLYYSALLQHQNPEDVTTLINIYANDKQKEKLRHAALGILLAETDVTLPPSDVFFGNRTRVIAHFHQLVNRFDNLNLDDLAREHFAAIAKTVETLSPGSAWGGLDRLVEQAKALDQTLRWPVHIANEALRCLREIPSRERVDYGVAVLALSAVFNAMVERFIDYDDAQAGWAERLDHYLARQPMTMDSVNDMLAKIQLEAPEQEIIEHLHIAIRLNPDSWGSLAAVKMLGELKAIDKIPDLFACCHDENDPTSQNVLRSALLKMGPQVASPLCDLLKNAAPAKRNMILTVLSHYPSDESIQAIQEYIGSCYQQDPDTALEIISRVGAPDFLPFLESEYRPGELVLGRVILLLSELHAKKPKKLTEIARDVKQTERLMPSTEDIRSFLDGDFPSTLSLALTCKRCGKRYHYHVGEVHMHPPAPNEIQAKYGEDMTPYRQGMVIKDDITCKNCSAVNDFELTSKALAVIGQMSAKITVLKQAGMAVPANIPLKFVNLAKEGEPSRSLLEIEEELTKAALLEPDQARHHLRLGQFYEYAKSMEKAKGYYLAALERDKVALEAMMGLAAITRAEGKETEALDWLNHCYNHLNDGHLHSEQPFDVFKKQVRKTRKELARQIGAKLDEDRVMIRFRVEPTIFPKNKPCPCGSGKKYKLCCMAKDQSKGEGKR